MRGSTLGVMIVTPLSILLISSALSLPNKTATLGEPVRATTQQEIGDGDA